MGITRFLQSLLLICFAVTFAKAGDWPRFRGPGGNGIATDSGDLPSVWSAGENLAWKVPLLGPGASSPVIYRGRVYVTCYSGYGVSRERKGSLEDLLRHLLCFDLESGEQLWRKDIPASLPEDSYYDTGVSSHGYASHTPCVDESGIYCFFGKGGVFAFDFEGNEVWRAESGKGSDPPKWGSSSSPILAGEVLVVTAAAESKSVIGYDKATGAKLWEVESSELNGMWGTPSMVSVDEHRQDLVMLIPEQLWGIDPRTGDRLWKATATSSKQAYTSIIQEGARVFGFSGQGGGSIALDVGGSGDVGEERTAWTSPINATYASPVKHGSKLYVVSRGVLVVLDAETGERLQQVRLKGARITGNKRFGALDYASPVVVGDRLYFLNASGQTFVYRLKDEATLIAVNELTHEKEFFFGSPAVSDGRMVIRSSKHLYCVAAERR